MNLPSVNVELRNQIRELVEKEGLTTPEIATRVGRSPQRVRMLRAEMGIPGKVGRHKEVDPAKLAQAKMLLEDEASYHEVSATTGIPRTTLRENLPGMGWRKTEGGQFIAFVQRHRNSQVRTIWESIREPGIRR